MSIHKESRTSWMRTDGEQVVTRITLALNDTKETITDVTLRKSFEGITDEERAKRLYRTLEQCLHELIKEVFGVEKPPC